MRKAKAKNGRVYLATRVEPEVVRKLKQICKRSERNLSAEVAFALKQYTAAEP